MQRFKNILYVMNNNDGISIKRAGELAVRNNAKLTLLDIVEVIPSWAGDRSDRLKWEKIQQLDIKARTKRLASIAMPYRDKIAIETKVLVGKKFLETIRQVLKYKHDLVMKDTSISQGLMSRVFTTGDMHLLRKCPCPVLLTKHDNQSDFSNILAAVDFDDLNDLDGPSANNSLNTQIMDMSISLANTGNCNLDFIHVYQVIGEGVLYSGRSGMSDYEVATYMEDMRRDHKSVVTKLLSRAKKRLGEKLFDSVNIKLHIVKGNPKIKIPEKAQQLHTDLIVMGTVARTGIPGFFIGNTAETILNNINCSVLALKPEGFISPVTVA